MLSCAFAKNDANLTPGGDSLLSISHSGVMVPDHDIEAVDAGLAVGGCQHRVGADESPATEWSAPSGAHKPNLQLRIESVCQGLLKVLTVTTLH